jgi:hypothetical protein
MSYLYQTVGLIKNGQYGTWDYQRWNLNQLDETCLIESDGVGSVAALNSYGLRWFRYDNGTFLSEDLTNGAANGPVDMNHPESRLGLSASARTIALSAARATCKLIIRCKFTAYN